MPSTARKPCPSARQLADMANSITCSYENVIPKAYRVDSLDSFSFTAEKSAQAYGSRRADDYV